jgi:hypothetical protein
MGSGATKHRTPVSIKDVKVGDCVTSGWGDGYIPCKKVSKKNWSKAKNGTRSYRLAYKDWHGTGHFREDELLGRCKCPSNKSNKTRKNRRLA